ncbi:DUF1329 domain-containing protein [Spongorhabdus nitratireducens]
MKAIKKTFQLSTLALALTTGYALAATDAVPTAAHDKKLTPVGAEIAGNKDGSIPAWTGGLKPSEGAMKADGSLENPFVGEKPLFTITAKNVEQYKDKLTPGQQAMFKRYPDTFTMAVYPTHRTASYPQKIYDASSKNHGAVKLAANGNGLSAEYFEGVPFIAPNNALEVIWNHVTRYRGGSFDRESSNFTVQANGTYQQTGYRDVAHFASNIEGWKPDSNILFYYKSKTLRPARLSGEVLLVHETLDQDAESRKAWKYLPSIRRVKRAPTVAFDNPRSNSQNLKTSDNYDMFNGSPKLYDWELVGKKEIYIPYNNYALMDKSVKVEDLIKPGHLVSDKVRYELHRVWEVKAKLKKGMRHVYSARTLYMDEDTWQVVASDQYDGQGNLWRVGLGYSVQYNPAQVHWLAGEGLYDLPSGRYVLEGMVVDTKGTTEFDTAASKKDYTPAAIRRWGK